MVSAIVMRPCTTVTIAAAAYSGGAQVLAWCCLGFRCRCLFGGILGLCRAVAQDPAGLINGRFDRMP
jgi:hypothetical protein